MPPQQTAAVKITVVSEQRDPMGAKYAAASHTQPPHAAERAAHFLAAQTLSPTEPGRHSSSLTLRQAGGSLPLTNAAHSARMTSVTLSLPRYCPLLMRIVGRMYTCAAAAGSRLSTIKH